MTTGLQRRTDRCRRRGRARERVQAGFGLVEIVIAMGLLVTLAAGVAQLFGLSAQSLVRARHRTSSLVLTVEKLEQVRADLAARGSEGVTGATGLQVEFLDQHGRLTSSASDGPRYERIWQLGRETDRVVTVRVQVAPIRPSGPGSLDGGVPPDGARLFTLVPVR